MTSTYTVPYSFIGVVFIPWPIIVLHVSIPPVRMQPIIVVLIKILILYGGIILRTWIGTIGIIAWDASVRGHKARRRLLVLCTILLSTLLVGVATHTWCIWHMPAAAVAIAVAVGLPSARCLARCLGLTWSLAATRRLTLTIARLARRSCAPALQGCFSAEETDCS